MNDNKVIRINDSNQKCCISRCIKLSSYKCNNDYYCWFHRIDLEINDKFFNL